MSKSPFKNAHWWLGGIALLAVATILFFSLRPGNRQSAGNVARAQSIDEAARKSAALNAAGEKWKARIAAASPKDFAALMREILAMGDPDLRALAARLLVTKWVTADLPGFIAFVDESEVDEDGDESAIWSLLAPALASVLTDLPDEVASRPELNEVVRRLIEYSARNNPAQALAWAKQWLLDDTLQSALATIAGEMAKQSPEKALVILGDIHSPGYRVNAIDAIGTVYGKSHPKEASAWAQTLAIPAERPYAMNSVLSAMAEEDPVTAAGEFVKFRDNMSAAYEIERAKEVAALNVPDLKAPAPGEQLTPDQLTDSELLPPREDPQLRLLEDAAVAVAESWAAVDPAKAMEWSKTLPEGHLRDDVVQSALTGWASEDPKQAYAYYQQNYASNPAPAEPIFEAWAQSSPEEAARTVDQMQDAAQRQNAIKGTVDGWLDGDGDQAALNAWVDRLPSNRERDLANAQIADTTSYDQPITAWQRATAIQDQRTRKDALKSTFASVVESDPAKARAMLAEAKNLTPDEMTRLNKMLNAVTAKVPN